jgi:hypothetical protein
LFELMSSGNSYRLYDKSQIINEDCQSSLFYVFLNLLKSY